MTEYNSFDIDSINNTCRACLKVTENVFPMSPEEINAYQKFTDKVNTNDCNMVICLICKWMLIKCMKFIEQVQKASQILDQVSEKESKTFLFIQLTDYDIGTTSPVVVHVGPEGDEEENNTEEYMAEDNIEEDDDEIPLVMLQDFKSKKRKNKEELKLETDIKQEDEIKSECETQADKSYRKRKRKKQEMREGFTSRMRQETDEYVVIKLTAEQVRQELSEKAQTDAFIRAPFKCESCVKGFNFEDVLLKHMEKHRMENGSFQCSICTQYCPSIVSLRGHLKSHTTRYKCKLCGQVRLSRQHLLEHYTITHTSAPITYTCDKCNFTTNKRTVIQRHVRSQHGANERHSCHTCGKLFNTIESLRVHTMRHDKTKRLQCERCDKHFIYPSLLHKHVQAVHERKEYYCVECDIKFKSPESMRLHFKKAKRHRDDSSYKHGCPQCSARFVSTSTLAVHLSSSHGEAKQHVCDVCSNHYSSKESLRGHIWRVHNQKREPPASCHLCEKSFTRKSILKIHVRSHTGERPFVCGCGAAFTQKASLKVHATRHTQKDHLPGVDIQNLPQES